MTVGELHQRLESYPDSTPVLVDGYEDGYEEMYLRLIRVTKAGRLGWWSGLYQYDKPFGIETLILGRDTKHE